MTYIIYKKMDIDERYINGKIYKIVCNETGEVYYGSTIESLKDRIGKHIGKKNCESKHIINRNNYYYELIENYSCNNRYELETRERWYIESNECINKRIPTRSGKEWIVNNREKVLEHKKTYYHKNKEQINEKLKEKMPCDICGSIVRKGDIKKHQGTKKCLKKLLTN